MIKQFRFWTTLATLFSCFLLFSIFSSSRESGPFSPSDVKQTCDIAWNGADSSVMPSPNRPLTISFRDRQRSKDLRWALKDRVFVRVLIDKSDTHDDDFWIESMISTSSGYDKERIQISYAQDNYSISLSSPAIEPKHTISPLHSKQSKRAANGGCVKIDVLVHIPPSKPLTGLSIDLDYGDTAILESAWGSLPFLHVRSGHGSFTAQAGQRLHVESVEVALGQGEMKGSILITKDMKMRSGRGDVDIDIGFSPFGKSARLDISTGLGDVDVLVRDEMYRDIHAVYTSKKGDIRLLYPPTYEGTIKLYSELGKVDVKGAAVETQARSRKGVLPAYFEGRQGPRDFLASTLANASIGNVHAEYVDPTERSP